MLLMASAPALMAAWGLGRFVLFRTGQDRTREISRALLEKIEPDLPFHHPESGAWLLRQKDAPGLIILDDRCTHLGCRYNWEPQKQLYRCPCHGSEFDLHGAVVRGPATRPLPHLLVRKKDEESLLLIDAAPEG
jgi:cytochrome b6-f complex iron-sulfur subunit